MSYHYLIQAEVGVVMSRVCDLTGKRRLVGNKVSHANNKTKMTQKPNLQTKRVFDPETGETIRLKLSTRAIRTLDKVGSLSKFLRKYRHLFQA
jgi:large subunit ribosomal protein L28